jgi:biopolymer transport protein ExbB
MENTYDLAHLWGQGDFVTRSVAVLLLAMSMLSWFVMLTKGWRALRLGRQTSRSEDRFWSARDLDAGLQALGADDPANPFRALAEEGAAASRHVKRANGALSDTLDTSDWLSRCLRSALDQIHADRQTGLGILASVGATAPFVGLFGTVWGIYHALISIAQAGQASIDKVAGPVGEALIMTALGLAVAIPAVLGYNALVRANKSLMARLNRCAHDLHAYFVTGARTERRPAQPPLESAPVAAAPRGGR